MNDLPGDLPSHLPDDLDTILKRPPIAASAAQRERLFEETAALLPGIRRAPHRRAVMMSAAAVLLVAGLAWFFARQRHAPIVPEPTPATVVVAAPATRPVSAVELEWHAFDSAPKQQAALYWSAGQAYVGVHGDYVSALRCYRQALEAGPAESLKITDEDDVLAMALKLERTYQEKSP